jgi:hypothetical protein
VPLLIEYTPQNSTANYGVGAGRAVVSAALDVTKSDNATVEAINAATGQMVWDHFIPTQGYRGGLSTSGNLVFATLSSGDMQMLNAQTGALVSDLYIGGPLNVLPSIGAVANSTANSGMEIIVPITAGAISWGNGVPGDLVALSLHNVPSTSGSGSTATVTASGSTATVTTTVGAGATATVTASGSTATVTASGTSSGVSTTTYAVAAIAVIFIIATGYLAMRGRKPAS